MLKYAKIVNKETKKVSVANSGTDWVKSQGYTEQDIEQSEKDGNWYLAGYAPRYTETELKEIETKHRKAEIEAELQKLDEKTIRPLRAKLAGTDTAEDIKHLKEYEEQAEILRAEYQAL